MWDMTWHFTADNLDTFDTHSSSFDRWYHWDPALLPWHPLLVSPELNSAPSPRLFDAHSAADAAWGNGKKMQKVRQLHWEFGALLCVWAKQISWKSSSLLKLRGWFSRSAFSLICLMMFNGLVKCESCSNHSGGNGIYMDLPFATQFLFCWWLNVKAATLLNFIGGHSEGSECGCSDAGFWHCFIHI